MFKFISVVAIAAIISISLSGCGKDNKARAKFKFSGAHVGVKSGDQPIIRMAPPEGAEDFDEFYKMLGAKKGNITPTKMVMTISMLDLFGDQLWAPIIYCRNSKDGVCLDDDVRQVDFTKSIIVREVEINPGFYDRLVFNFSDQNGKDLNEEPWIDWFTLVSFPIPAGFDLSKHAYSTFAARIDPTTYSKLTHYPNNITLVLSNLQPAWVDRYYAFFSGHNEPNTGKLLDNPLGSNVDYVNSIEFSGDTYKIYQEPSMVFVPFEGIEIPEGASVMFEIVWDVEGIIEWYEGATDCPSDDIFVLRNRFWEGFSIRTYIE